MARKSASYTGTATPSAIGLPDFNPTDGDVLGSSLSLGQHGQEASPIARAVSINRRAASAQPQGGLDVLRGSPLAAPPPTAPTDTPPPVQPPTQPPPTFQPPATPPPTPPATPGPLPGAGGPYDPSRLNYEGNTYSGPPVVPGTPTYRSINETDLGNIQRFMDSKGIKIDPAWRKALVSDPSAFIQKYWDFNGLGQYIHNSIGGKTAASTAVDPNAASKYYDQANYNQGLERLRTAGLTGARQDEEQLLANLQSRGLLNSGVAARELGRLQEDRTRNYQQAAYRLNEILFSNASDQAKREALTRLQAELESANQERLLRLKYDLERQYQQDQHKNDFLSFLSTVGGGIVGAATGGPIGALYGAGAGGQIIGNDAATTYRNA